MIRSVSHWAVQHKGIAQLFFLACLLVYNLTAIGAGLLIDASGMQVPLMGLYLCGLTVIAVCYFYSIKKRQQGGNLFWIRKRCTAVLLSMIFLMMTGLANRQELPALKYGSLGTTAYAATLSSDKTLAGQDLSERQHKGWQWGNKQIQKLKAKAAQLKIWYRSLSNGGKGISIAVVVILSVLAFAGLLMLSCAIACEGMEALALVVFIFGVLAIVFFAIRTTRYFLYGKRKKGALF